MPPPPRSCSFEKGAGSAGLLIRAVAVPAAGTTRIERVIAVDAGNNRGCHTFETAVAPLGAHTAPSSRLRPP
ncbi:hypothetical protein [Pseudonocardia pini]|uniref:hypothetical protein n=1 Tax=Pseudonocardia pini TaxID=2758030 RepID=UPI0015EFFD7A|nr:hypothetical protein [Pseudonocardia pini]